MRVRTDRLRRQLRFGRPSWLLRRQGARVFVPGSTAGALARALRHLVRIRDPPPLLALRAAASGRCGRGPGSGHCRRAATTAGCWTEARNRRGAPGSLPRQNGAASRNAIYTPLTHKHTHTHTHSGIVGEPDQRKKEGGREGGRKGD